MTDGAKVRRKNQVYYNLDSKLRPTYSRGLPCWESHFPTPTPYESGENNGKDPVFNIQFHCRRVSKKYWSSPMFLMFEEGKSKRQREREDIYSYLCLFICIYFCTYSLSPSLVLSSIRHITKIFSSLWKPFGTSSCSSIISQGNEKNSFFLATYLHRLSESGRHLFKGLVEDIVCISSCLPSVIKLVVIR